MRSHNRLFRHPLTRPFRCLVLPALLLLSLPVAGLASTQGLAGPRHEDPTAALAALGPAAARETTIFARLARAVVTPPADPGHAEHAPGRDAAAPLSLFGQRRPLPKRPFQPIDTSPSARRDAAGDRPVPAALSAVPVAGLSALALFGALGGGRRKRRRRRRGSRGSAPMAWRVARSGLRGAGGQRWRRRGRRICYRSGRPLAA
jgi:hypothetical protein